MGTELNEEERSNARLAAAKGWYGYGRWGAPFWFVGMEPGGSEQDASYEKWLELGASELIDCKAHHLSCDFTRWHRDRRPATQTTWRRLIEIALSIQGRSADLESIRNYQRDYFGSIVGDSALIEISALHAKNTHEQVDRNIFRDQRIRLIAARLLEHQPKLVLFYGKSHREHYERVTNKDFDQEGVCWIDRTLCILTVHPAARITQAGRYWKDLSTKIKSLTTS